MVKSEVGCRLENTPYLTVSDAEMTGFHKEVKNLQLKIPRGTPWKGCSHTSSLHQVIGASLPPMIQILSSKLVQMNGEHNGSAFLSSIEPMHYFYASRFARPRKKKTKRWANQVIGTLLDTTVDIDNIHLRRYQSRD
jgi:hypothetical protein